MRIYVYVRLALGSQQTITPTIVYIGVYIGVAIRVIIVYIRVYIGVAIGVIIAYTRIYRSSLTYRRKGREYKKSLSFPIEGQGIALGLFPSRPFPRRQRRAGKGRESLLYSVAVGISVYIILVNSKPIFSKLLS